LDDRRLAYVAVVIDLFSRRAKIRSIGGRCAIELVVRKVPTGTLVSENERITAPVKGFSAVVYTRRGAVV
jgi:hypothetical protein